jgi:oligopeptide/dipeptide ABC transporter ATP-binding protein
LTEKHFVEFRNLDVVYKLQGQLTGSDLEKEIFQIDDENKFSFGVDQKIIDGVDYSFFEEETLHTVDKINLIIEANENVCLVGESTSGKSSVLLSLLQYELPFVSHSGNILVNEDKNILKLDKEELEQFRKNHFSYIPNLPRNLLDNWLVFQSKALNKPLNQKQKEIIECIGENFDKSTLPDFTAINLKYVSKLTSKEAQKLNIFLALVADTKLVLGDEVMNSLDITSQTLIRNLFQELQDKYQIQFIFATQNIISVSNITQKVAVMYGGEVIETASTGKFLHEPSHPYSQALLKALPWYSMWKKIDLEEMIGELPLPNDWPRGCKFHPRCPQAQSKCTIENPPTFEVANAKVKCWLYE